MTDEAAKELAAAMTRLAKAVERLTANSPTGGLTVDHRGFPVPAGYEKKRDSGGLGSLFGG